MAATIKDGGRYYIMNWQTKTVVDLDSGSKADSTKVFGYEAHFDDPSNQAWIAKSAGDGYFILTNGASGTVLDLAGGSSDNGTPVIGYHNHDGDNQKWKFDAFPGSGATPSFFIFNKATGTALDLYNGGSENKTPITGWQHGNGPVGDGGHQRWIVIPAY